MTADITLEENTLFILGDINFHTAEKLWEKSLPLLSKLEELNFNLSRVHSVNSSALALVLEWIKYAREQGKKIHFHHLTKEIVTLAKVAKIESLLETK